MSIRPSIEVVDLEDSGDDFQPVKGPPIKKKKNTVTKTARKTMSSFTPIQQIKRIKPDLITLDEEDVAPKDVPAASDHKDKVSSNGGSKNGEAIPPTEAHKAVAVAVEGLLNACRDAVTPVEHDKIKRKLEKRQAAIRDLENAKLATFIDIKAAQISSNPKNAFTYLKKTIEEMLKFAEAKNGAKASAATPDAHPGTSSKLHFQIP